MVHYSTAASVSATVHTPAAWPGDTIMCMSTARLYCIIVTYRRLDGLKHVIANVTLQTVRPALVVVVDNGGSDAVAQIVCAGIDQGLRVLLIQPGTNIGPSGGTAVAMTAILSEARDCDWITRVDDDRTHWPTDLFERVLNAATQASQHHNRVGAIGAAGARFSYRRARLVAPDLRATTSAVTPVDYVATGHLPAYSVSAVRSVGVFRAELFFGYTEVEYGLRLRSAGWLVLLSRDLRIAAGLAEHAPRRSRVRATAADWRRYYALRNLLVVLCERGHCLVAVRVAAVRGILKPLLSLVNRPRMALAALQSNSDAILDALMKRLGPRAKYMPGPGFRSEDYDATI